MAAAGMVDPRFAGFLSTLGCTLTTQMALARAIGASESAQQSGKAQGVVNQCSAVITVTQVAATVPG